MIRTPGTDAAVPGVEVEPPGPPPAPVAQPALEAVLLAVAYRARLRDISRAAASTIRHSKISAFGAFLLVPSLVFGLLTGDVILALVGTVFLASLASGWGPGALVALSMRGRTDLFQQGIQLLVTDAALSETTVRLGTRMPWTSLRLARDMSGDVMFDFGSSMATYVPKRVLDAGQTTTLLAIAERHAKVERRSSWLLPAIGTGLGIGLTAILLVPTL